MLIYKKQESVNEEELYKIGIKELKKQFKLLKYSILLYPLLMGGIFYITKSTSFFFIAFFIVSECFLMLGALNYGRTIKYNKNLNTTEGIAEYIEKQYRDDNGEIITTTAIKVNGIYFDIPEELHTELKQRNIRLYYLNNEDALVVGAKYLD